MDTTHHSLCVIAEDHPVSATENCSIPVDSMMASTMMNIRSDEKTETR